MGQYGQIKSVIINKHSTYDEYDSSAYISYSNVYEASIAILVSFILKIKRILFKSLKKRHFTGS